MAGRQRYLDGYLRERRYFHLAADEIDNPDQRIAEDVNTFTGRSLHFLLILLGSLMQLVAFSAVLRSLSHTLLSLGLFGRSLDAGGHPGRGQRQAA